MIPKKIEILLLIILFGRTMVFNQIKEVIFSKYQFNFRKKSDKYADQMHVY
jgi:hypothetical protein